jgi:hypothetical protein
LRKTTLFVVVLVAFTNKLEDLLPLMPADIVALDGAAPCKLVRIGG